MQKVDKREKPFHIQRGDVYMADINIGSHSKNSDGIENNSEQRGVRPVVVTQCNRQNRTATTVVVAIGTSQIKRLDLPYHVLLPKTKGLPRQTLICAEQRFTLSRDRFISYCCTLDRKVMKKTTRACHMAEEEDKRRRAH